MNDQIRIQMMDHFTIYINEQKADYLVNKTRKGVALMEYLILHQGQPTPNYRLLVTLWSEDKSANPENALKTLAIVMTLLATAKAFAYMMTELRIPAMITEVLLSVTSNKYVLMLIINILLLLLGCFMDMAPLITIMTPILVPVVTNPAIGMDPVHFGVVMIFNLAVGLCTPPVGSALFVGCAIGKTPIERTSKNMLPLYAVMVTVLLLVTYIPAISLMFV